MNYIGLSSVIVLAATLAAACTKKEGITLVRSEEYSSRECWFDQRGDFVAFLVLATEGRLAVPDFISTSCLVNGGYSSHGEATILHLGTIPMTDAYGKLQQAFPAFEVSSNTVTDQPLPSSSSRLYFFKARLRRVPSQSRTTIYAPTEILQLTDMNVSFLQLLDMSVEQREELLSEYTRVNRTR